MSRIVVCIFLRSLRLVGTLPIKPTSGEPFKLDLDAVELYYLPTQSRFTGVDLTMLFHKEQALPPA